MSKEAEGAWKHLAGRMGFFLRLDFARRGVGGGADPQEIE